MRLAELCRREISFLRRSGWATEMSVDDEDACRLLAAGFLRAANDACSQLVFRPELAPVLHRMSVARMFAVLWTRDSTQGSSRTAAMAARSDRQQCVPEGLQDHRD